MVNVCDRAGAKEDLTTVPVMLSDISEVENTIPLTETSYLEVWLRHRQWLEPVILKFEAEGWTTISRLIIDRCYFTTIYSPQAILKGDFESRVKISCFVTTDQQDQPLREDIDVESFITSGRE